LARSGLVVAVAGVVVAGIYAIFWPLSDLIARHDVGAIIGPHRTAALQQHAAALQVARDAARGRVVAFGAGLFAAGALVYTARNFSLSRQGQVTDRYTKAIEQLGSTEIDVRIGGIYALERIARDSARDHPTIMENLAAFVRDHSSEQWPLPAVYEAGAKPSERKTRPDVQAAATVIGRRTIRYDRRLINLNAAHLAAADLRGAHLTAADLIAANLSDADLRGAHLTGANLMRANLTGANFDDANLSDARFREVDFGGVSLTGADLTGAELQFANFSRAYVTGVYQIVPDRIPPGVQVPGPNLTGAKLYGAVWPLHAEEPEGWQRDPSGGLRPTTPDSGTAAAEVVPSSVELRWRPLDHQAAF
jgi:hypothetical protein